MRGPRGWAIEARMRIALCLLAACAAIHAPPPFTPAARIVEGELAADQDVTPDCSKRSCNDEDRKVGQFELADDYSATWKAGGTVHIAVRGAELYFYGLGQKQP